MPKGLYDIIFNGGTLDGNEMQIPTQNADDVIVYDSETFFVKEKNGNISIYKGKRKASIPWLSFSRTFYRKTEKNKNGIIQYTVEKSIQIERCQATTLSGTQCGHEAIEGSFLCKTHRNKQKLSKNTS